MQNVESSYFTTKSQLFSPADSVHWQRQFSSSRQTGSTLLSKLGALVFQFRADDQVSLGQAEELQKFRADLAAKLPKCLCPI